MTDLSDALTAEWRALLGADSLSGRESALARLARDFFWFSPVLRCQLDSKRAGLGVRPSSVDEVRAMIRARFRFRAPIVRRGAGMGSHKAIISSRRYTSAVCRSIRNPQTDTI
jgi:FAD/FMN-containing dehydrogenase